MPTFTYFGEELSYADVFPRFLFAEFCEICSDGDDADSPRATGIALKLATECIAPADRKRFRELSRKNNAKVDDWLRIVNEFTEEEAVTPTERPSDSSDGPSDTVETSEPKHVASVTSLPTPDEPKRISGTAVVAARRAGLIPA